ncbi:MAG: maleylpyruvate isomerase [Rhodobacteraceae bacterium]|nr:MAG: maleylpyruvate isomerase [Paracoccaceae bacterium]
MSELSNPENAARDALHARQGLGARYDAANAPAKELLLARRGTAYFARKLNELTDDDLNLPSLQGDWDRRHLIAHIGYHARALVRLLEGARMGKPQKMYGSAAERDAEITLGATLPSRALRGLFQHSEVHLNVEWRDLDAALWDVNVTTFEGCDVRVRDTALLRAKEVWRGAINLGNGGSIRDVPPELKDYCG